MNNPICRVCGDDANGLNYNEFTCTPCKVFFHRNSGNSQKYKCRKFGNCEIDIFTRKRCSACRLSKCFTLGMKRKTISIDNSFENSEFLQIFESMIKQEFDIKENQNQIKLEIPKSIKQSNVLYHQELKLISDIHKAGSVFGDEGGAKITRKSTAISDCFFLPDIYFQWITKFCSKIEPFNSLGQTEQLKVLKSFCFDMLCLRLGFRTDSLRYGFPRFLNYESNEAIFIDLKIYRAKNQKYDFMDCYTDYWFSLQNEMENDFIIRDLLSALQLFKEQKDKLSNREFIKYHHTQYSHLLYRYLEIKYKNPTRAHWKYFSLMKLLDQLDQIKGYELILCNNEVQFEQIPHIVVEMFDLA